LFEATLATTIVRVVAYSAHELHNSIDSVALLKRRLDKDDSHSGLEMMLFALASLLLREELRFVEGGYVSDPKATGWLYATWPSNYRKCFPPELAGNRVFLVRERFVTTSTPVSSEEIALAKRTPA
jgi:hypothetical protein